MEKRNQRGTKKRRTRKTGPGVTLEMVSGVPFFLSIIFGVLQISGGSYTLREKTRGEEESTRN